MDEEALKAYDKAIELNPKDAYAWLGKGIALLELGRYEEALEAYDMMVELNPKDAAAWVGRGTALLGLGRREEALKACDKVVELNPEDAAVWAGRGAVLLGLGRYEEALKAYDKAVELNPEVATAWRGKGTILGRLEKYEEALKAYDKAIELNPKDADVWVGKDVALLKLGRYKEALKALDKVIELNPKDASVWVVKGIILLEMDKYRKALEALDKAIELNPKDADAWQGKAEASYYINLTTEALEAIDKALSYSEGKPSFLNTKGVILIRLGRYEDAICLFDEAFLKKSEHRFMFNKVAALLRLQRSAEAEEALQRAIDLTSGGKDRESKRSEKEYRKQLDRLRRSEYPIQWIQWWFNENDWIGWGKRILGGFLLVLLILYLVLPLVTLNVRLLEEQGRLWWISAGKDWQSYMVPVAAIIILLMSPMLRRFGPQGIELQPILPPPEEAARRLVGEMQPRFD